MTIYMPFLTDMLINLAVQKERSSNQGALMELLKNIHLLPLAEQEKSMLKVFEDWKGELEQFDDICVIGVPI